MPPAAFESTIPAKERQQTHALDRAATGIVVNIFKLEKRIIRIIMGTRPLVSCKEYFKTL
jgi:hypothetical protein